MHFCVQYDTETGTITGTVHAKKAPGPMPAGRGQIVFKDSDHLDVTGKKVNLKTLALEDAAPASAADRIAKLQAQIDAIKAEG